MPSKPAVIIVIGSLNVDLVTRTPRVPVGGETLTSESFNIGWGGKGANQAVACARLSRTHAQASSSQASDVEVRMVGAIGDDEFHEGFLKALREDALKTDGVQILKGKKTGVAVIVVETGTGENRIMFCPGANGDVEVRDLVDADASVALFQLELPLEVVLYNMKVARRKGVQTVINPAPAIPLPMEAYEGLDHLIVNETEAATLSGMEKPTSWDEVAAVFIARGVKNVIITLGGEGVYYKTSKQQSSSQNGHIVPARKVKVVDTTAAGDTFAGAYTVAVARWKIMSQGADFDLDAAIAHANRAASMTVQKAGAQSSIPWANEVPDS
ncbi:ribokinase [Pyrenophora tritici-repentis]|uniref:Ribokinase n=1 Tax=Pyrenophora tritici-repentis (strain Pt-1C-BFP) TaxID=426418 RepID=B2WM74_PYRTR|nr:ribokinase [Pyrenophora tritici-repentis Pt-1C-BFP]KAF7442766.1 ribokinase [Pyrenophora tritici-repentis]EDU44134.1 ribokinase [Pyrenophora tritici-repentis Pt-1C-BFP]KAI0570253.1 ribokinase [Pyrenophora tritici-repentis]KAI0571720.1 ribokinase [Pyrenophora tritici-repentis]KAI0605219.1 ribokinase [Pyrenophora tritici-repentis]